MSRFPFAKIAIVLATIFGVCVGLCGITAVGAGAMSGNGSFLVGLGMLELGGMALSLLGLFLTLILWVIAALMGLTHPEANETVKLFDQDRDKDNYE